MCKSMVVLVVDSSRMPSLSGLNRWSAIWLGLVELAGQWSLWNVGVILMGQMAHSNKEKHIGPHRNLNY